ncbi:hypothetical protein [Bacillus mycoides]|nr:hypothetical protein [Bacillus mycoides]
MNSKVGNDLTMRCLPRIKGSHLTIKEAVVTLYNLQGYDRF